MKVLNKEISSFYDKRMFGKWQEDYFDGSDFHNFGYWTKDTIRQKEACEALMEKLLAFFPERKGTILDVACGMGETTRHLLRNYNPSRVIGINILYNQLERSKLNVPSCAFLQMDATKFGFGNSAFDQIICVEAAFHFNTREDFIKEAVKILKPGGHLVISDILVSKWMARWNPRIPKKNWVKDLEEYKDLYLRSGFQDVKIVDATNECWIGFYNNLYSWRREKLQTGEINLIKYMKLNLRYYIAKAGIKYYLLVAARKA